jgi:hypothetical protein
MITAFLRNRYNDRKRLINTALQRGDCQRHQTRTALAVFKWLEQTAKAVHEGEAVLYHLAEAMC